MPTPDENVERSHGGLELFMTILAKNVNGAEHFPSLLMQGIIPNPAICLLAQRKHMLFLTDVTKVKEPQ